MSTYEEKMLRRLATLSPDSDTLRRLLENATPVPWAPVEHGSGPAAWTVETDDGAVVVEVHDDDDHPGSLEVAGVDARLIAAAPALAAEVLRLRRIEAAVRADIAAEDAHNAANAAREAAWRNALAKDVDEMSAEGQRRHRAIGRAVKAWQKAARATIAARAELRSVVIWGGR